MKVGPIKRVPHSFSFLFDRTHTQQQKKKKKEEIGGIDKKICDTRTTFLPGPHRPVVVLLVVVVVVVGGGGEGETNDKTKCPYKMMEN